MGNIFPSRSQTLDNNVFSNRKIIKELFREFFELPFIKKYQPAANDDKDKKKNLKPLFIGRL